MVREFQHRSYRQLLAQTAREIGYRTIGAYLLMILLLVAIAITFILAQKSQDIQQNAAVGDVLTVDSTKIRNQFSKKMLGQALVNWEHSWGKPFPNEIPGLSTILKEQGAGLIRYAGGLWANYVGFDRTPQRIPYTAWTKNGNTYSFSYGTNELESLNNLADAIGAEVMIQVNIAANDPLMWADMVRYVNVEKGYNFTYWELGNEFDIDTALNISPQIYAERVKAYVDAMKDVDPTIRIISGVPGTAHDGPRQGWSDSVTDLSHYLTLSAQAVSPKGRKVDDLSYHWYQACNSTSYSDLLRYKFDGVATNSWRNAYSRIWSEIIPIRIDTEIIGTNTNMTQGITELNFDACNYDHALNGNHLNALWASDVIGRLAYNGLDFITWYEGYANQGYSTSYANDGNNPTQLFLRPSYYAFLMYNKYFGDQIVESTTFNPTSISIWASKDSRDGKLKLRVTNLSSADITTPINVTGFNASTGDVYVLKSSNPTDVSSASSLESSSTTINGVKLSASNLLNSISQIQPTKITVNGSSFVHNFPAYSTTAIVLSEGSTQPTLVPPTATPTVASQNPTPTPTLLPSPTPTRTPTPTPTRTPTPTPTKIPLATSTPTTIPTPTPTPTPQIGNGTGLKGDYFNNRDLTSLFTSRIDSTINFNWGYNAPFSGMQSDTFSIVWSGFISAPVTGTYTFYTQSDDGVRLWINNILLINDWKDHANKQRSAQIALIGGQRVSIKMDYYENRGRANAQLLWAYPGKSKHIIPTQNLFAN